MQCVSNRGSCSHPHLDSEIFAAKSDRINFHVCLDDAHLITIPVYFLLTYLLHTRLTFYPYDGTIMYLNFALAKHMQPNLAPALAWVLPSSNTLSTFDAEHC